MKYSDELSFSKHQVDLIRLGARLENLIAIIPLVVLILSVLILSPSFSLLIAQESNYTNTDDIRNSKIMIRQKFQINLLPHQ
jgi:hypothetical protein